jgi:hypothetical protein
MIFFTIEINWFDLVKKYCFHFAFSWKMTNFEDRNAVMYFATKNCILLTGVICWVK